MPGTFSIWFSHLILQLRSTGSAGNGGDKRLTDALMFRHMVCPRIEVQLPRYLCRRPVFVYIPRFSTILKAGSELAMFEKCRPGGQSG